MTTLRFSVRIYAGLSLLNSGSRKNQIPLRIRLLTWKKASLTYSINRLDPLGALSGAKDLARCRQNFPTDHHQSRPECVRETSVVAEPERWFVLFIDSSILQQEVHR